MQNTMKNNCIVGLYPLTKFAIAITISVVGLILPGIIEKLICFGVLNILAILSGMYGVFIKRIKNSVGILFIFLIIIQTFFGPGDDIMFQVWILGAKKSGLLFALKLGANLLCIGGAIIWFFVVTKEKDFVLALEKKGMSSKASYVVLSTLQMVPVMKKRAQTIMNAQRARGVETEGNLFVRARVFVPILVPLVLSSIQGTEERALTLEARGFSITTPATHLYDLTVRPIDKIVTIITFIIIAAAMIGRVILCFV